MLATADGVGIVDIMRTAAGVSKTAVWRWQARFMDEGVEGLLPKFAAKVRDIVGLYVDPPPIPWCSASMRSRKFRPWIAPSRAYP